MGPKILQMKVWEIGKDPIFYGYDDEDSVYSILDKEIVRKPSHINLLTARDLEPKDLSSVILHNRMSSEDFDCLKEHGLVPEELQALFTKIQELQRQLESLKVEKTEKREEAPEEQELSKTMVDALINIVKTGILGAEHSVLAQILEGTKGLTEQEKKLLKLVGSHFSLDTDSFL